MIVINNKKRNNKEEWVILVKALSATEASIIESMLAEEGIPVLKKSKGSGAYLEIYMGQSITGWDIYVPEQGLEHAREIIYHYQNTCNNKSEPNQDMYLTDSGNDIIEEQSVLSTIRPAAKWVILIIFIVPTILGLLWYILHELFNLIKGFGL